MAPTTSPRDSAQLTLDDYLARNPTTGLLVARGDTIVVERYQYGRTDRHRLTSASMAKTVPRATSTRSTISRPPTCPSSLADTEYGRTSLRHLLQMSSGVRFNEEYSGRDDRATLVTNTYRLGGGGGPSAVMPFNERYAPPGTKFSYASAETQVLGLVLARANGRPVAEYLEQKIWQPMGADADATFGCLNAVLRDYARLGLLLALDGNWRGRQVIPAPWTMDATTVRADQPHLRPGTATPVFGYGYQTWILPIEHRMFMLWGIRGQRIFVDPTSKLVMVNTAVHKLPVDLPPLVESGALWFALVGQLGSQ